MALALLYWVNPESAVPFADEILHQADADEAVKDVAMQIRLTTLTDDQLKKEAVKLLNLAPPKSKKMVLQDLAFGGANSYRRVSSGSDVQIPYRSMSMGYSGSNSDSKLRVPKAPDGMELSTISPLLDSDDADLKALATYFSILLGGDQPLSSLVEYWRRNQDDEGIAMLVVDAIVVRHDDESTPVLTQIYEVNGGIRDTSFSSRLYWTIRSMTGPGAMALRQRILNEVGMSRLN